MSGRIVEIVSALAIIAGGIFFIAKLDARVTAIEGKIDGLESGPRGRSCEAIVAEMINATKNGDPVTSDRLEAIADKWGCADLPAVYHPKQ